MKKGILRSHDKNMYNLKHVSEIDELGKETTLEIYKNYNKNLKGNNIKIIIRNINVQTLK